MLLPPFKTAAVSTNKNRNYTMKYCITLLLVACLFTTSYAQPVFTYGKWSVDKEEFTKAYNKNKTPVADKEKAIREYLELYTRFKLKVQAAKDAGLDTLQQLQYDLQNFRGQIEENYLQDDNAIDALLTEVLIRNQKDIRLHHFTVPITLRKNNADTLQAWQAMQKLKEMADVKYSNPAEIAAAASLPNAKITGQDLGYITALSLPYLYENIAYALAQGQTSAIIRTKSALHLFKQVGERKSAGKWKTAQILFSIPPDASSMEIAATKKLADSIHALLQNGADFANLARLYSSDKISFQNGGELPEFGTGRYESSFENAVFALANDGDFTPAFLTAFGYHIVKRITVTPTPTDKSNDAYVAEMRKLLLQDNRINKAKENFARAVMTQTGFKRNIAVTDKQLFKYADSVVAAGDIMPTPISKTTVFNFYKQKVTGADWLSFVRDYKLNTDVYKGEDNKALLEKYISTISMEYYRKHLEEYNAEFKYQVQEFREGNMLFEMMERKIWSKAAADSNGLAKYYENNKAKYLWGPSATVLLFNCTTADAATTAIAALRSGKGYQQIVEESNGMVQADSARYETAQLSLPADLKLKPGMVLDPVTNTADNSASFVKIIALHPVNEQRSFDEAKGMVINDFQNFMEEKWLTELRKKYPVKVNETVVKQLVGIL
jgi:peptidyl-prolyl cis-trans isomerase SurA